MPYRMRKTNEGYCVFNSETGENKGCSDSRKMGVEHMAALYAAEGREKKEISDLMAEAIADFTKETGEVFTPEEINEKDWFGGEPSYFYPYSARSYAEVEAQREAIKTARAVSELLDLFPTLARNAIDDPNVTDKASAIETLASELAGKITELNGESESEGSEDDDMEDEMKELESVSKIDANAASRTPKMLDRIGKAAEGLLNFVKSFSGEKSDNNDLMIWKDANGQYRWIARYSNNFIDRDTPPDIISAESHRRFVKMVDEGKYPYPVIELWHNKEWEFGQADWLAYDDSGFAVASGFVYPGNEGIAEALSKLKNVGVSHGMPVTSIVRDVADPRVIKEHQTIEISPLPLWAAANQLTSFQVMKGVDASEEDTMGLPADKKKAALANWGIDPTLLEALENTNQKDAAAATEAGIESKEANEVSAEAPETPVAPAVESEKPAEESEETSEDNAENKEAAPDIRTIAAAFAEVVNPMVDALKEMQEKHAKLEKEIADLKAAKSEVEEAKAAATEKDAMIAALSPVAALMASFGNSRAVGSPAVEVKSGDPLGSASPKEADNTQPLTGIQFLDTMLTPAKR